MSTNDILKNIYLHDEIETSIKLVQLGLGELQNLDMVNDFYYLPLQLLSSGFERLMKCIICLGYWEKNKNFPKTNDIKHHDLIKFKNEILNNYYSTADIPALVEDYEYLSKDKNLGKLIYLLSEFGKLARYYNLDIISDAREPGIDVKNLWQEYENQILSSNKNLIKNFSNFGQQEEIYEIIVANIVLKLERFARALARQFTLGKLGELAKQLSPSVFPFLMLSDKELGKKDYRKHTTRFNQKEKKAHKRNIIDYLNRRFNKRYKSKKLYKNNYSDKWPFRANEITIECRDKYWCIVTIEGKDYALNGVACGRYKLQNVHDAGMAILGISVDPFLNNALKLGEQI